MQSQPNPFTMQRFGRGEGAAVLTGRRILMMVSCAVIVLALSFGSTAVAKTKDGCKALVAADVNAALASFAGGQVGEGAPTIFKGYTSCTWRFPNGDQVFIGVDKVSAPAKADFKKRSKEPGAEKVTGLKNSFFSPVTESGGGATITFIDGTTFVNLQYFSKNASTDADALKDPLTALAKKAAKAL